MPPPLTAVGAKKMSSGITRAGLLLFRTTLTYVMIMFRSWSSIRPSRYGRSAIVEEMLISRSAANTSASTAATSLVRNGVRRRVPCSCIRNGRFGLRRSVSARRAVNVTGSGRWLAQHVPHAAQSVDQPGLHVVHLAPQVRDVRLDDVVVAAEVVLPHVVEDLRLGQHPVRVQHQVTQQLELGRRELDALAGPVDLVRLLVQLQVGEDQPGR